jgi:hypothetical protein
VALRSGDDRSVVFLNTNWGKHVCPHVRHATTPRQASWSECGVSSSGVVEEGTKRLVSVSHRTVGEWLGVRTWVFAHLNLECVSCVGQCFPPRDPHRSSRGVTWDFVHTVSVHWQQKCLEQPDFPSFRVRSHKLST